MKNIIPRLVGYHADGSVESVNYRHLSALMLDQIQEHETKINDLTTKVNILLERVDELETQAEDFEARLTALENP